MADLKIGNNGGIARRSARVFEDDHDVSRKPEVYGAESGGHNNRRRDNTEQMIGKDKVDKITVTQTRRSSLSSTMTLSEDGLSAYNILTRENSRDGMRNYLLRTAAGLLTVPSELAMSQADLPKKAAKPKIPGRPRNFARVTSGIYRSGYPETEDHAFLKELGLKTIVYVCSVVFIGLLGV